MIKLTAAEPNDVPDGLNQNLKQWQSDVVLDETSLVLKGYNYAGDGVIDVPDNDALCVLAILKFHLDATAEIDRIIWKYDEHRTGADKELSFVIGNGILNFIDRRGFRLVYSNDTANEYLLKLVKFEYDEIADKFTLDLTDYFEPHCK